jgi:hypothetical protein
MCPPDDFDISAAGLRADGSDLRISIEALASKLEASLPSQTRVRRTGGGMLGRGQRQVRSVQVQLGEVAYELTVDRGRVEGMRDRRVGGISIKRDPLGPAEWVNALTEELRAQAERSAEARAALQRLLG